jgi:hypothetical protein
MNFSHHAFHILMSSLAVILLASCGGDKSKSQNATFLVNPGKPIVITADATVDDGKTIEGPWFEFGMSMTNNTAEPITIVALELEIFSQSTNGISDSRTVAFTPGQFNFTVGTNTECKFTTFGTWDPGQTKALTVSNSITACTRGARFAVGGNSSGPGGTNFRYRVKAKPLGWFGTENAATDRFDRSITFFTQ